MIGAKESPRRDLNPQSLPPEGNALSIRPHGLVKDGVKVGICNGLWRVGDYCGSL